MSINVWDTYIDNNVGTLNGTITDNKCIETIFDFANEDLLYVYDKRVNKHEVRKNKVYVFDKNYINRWTDGYVWSNKISTKKGHLYYQCNKVRDINGKVKKIKIYNGLTKIVAISKCGNYGLVNYY